ncbi:glycoside hydrolase family 5 protein [Cerasicoccus fimbriatus]|uniref:glycoside hydrolase family 5 protein n=1 Tax=Cerasicoccus fimbriatus TaxID=3014554 RepID=UPI0022B2FF72|nr:cellulase family glycosylhydrolase [Cerasicoccus sp. TK19100]
MPQYTQANSCRTINCNNQGFAAIITLLIMAFLVRMVVKIKAFAETKTHSASVKAHQNPSTAKPLLALNLAHRELQRLTSPYQHVTASADTPIPDDIEMTPETSREDVDATIDDYRNAMKPPLDWCAEKYKLKHFSTLMYFRQKFICFRFVYLSLLILLGLAHTVDAKPRNYPPDPPMEAVNKENWPSEIHVEGNRLVNAEGQEVWLQGVAIPGLEIMPEGHGAVHSTIIAIEDWNANVIRLPIKDEYWYGHGKPTTKSAGQTDGGEAYRLTVDNVINSAANRGAYVVLDHHRYRAVKQEHLPFWAELAERYKNHPAVLFDIINEPHSISWEVWRNGGFVSTEKNGADEAGFLSEEEKKSNQGFESPGMQQLVDTVRETGARNIIVAGGLSWAYDLSGILNGYALDDDTGNGIMYATHVYNWKKGWQEAFLDAAKHYPILVGEVGADVNKMEWLPANIQEDPYTWVPDMLGVIQAHKLNWTGWSFHAWATPVMISDWDYTPTPYWGAYAKRALSGESFELTRLR